MIFFFNIYVHISSEYMKEMAKNSQSRHDVPGPQPVKICMSHFVSSPTGAQQSLFVWSCLMGES